MQKTSHTIPLLLAVFIAALIVWSGINPSDRAVWYAEIIPVSIVFIALVATTASSVSAIWLMYS